MLQNIQTTTTRKQASPPQQTSTDLPSVKEFLQLMEDENRHAKQDVSAYSVYHKYNKGC